MRLLTHLAAGAVGALIVLGAVQLPAADRQPQPGAGGQRPAAARRRHRERARHAPQRRLAHPVDELGRSLGALARHAGQARPRHQGAREQSRQRPGDAPGADRSSRPGSRTCWRPCRPPSRPASRRTLPRFAGRVAELQKGIRDARTPRLALARAVRRQDRGRPARPAPRRLKGEVEERMQGAAKAADVAPLASQARRARAGAAGLHQERGRAQRQRHARAADAGARQPQARHRSRRALRRRARRASRKSPAHAQSERRWSATSLEGVPTPARSREVVPPRPPTPCSMPRPSRPTPALVDRLLSGARSHRAGAQGGPRSPTTPASRPPSAAWRPPSRTAGSPRCWRNAKKLPPKAALAGEDWLKKVEARQAVEQALADVEAALKSSLGSVQPPAAGKGARRHGREMIRLVIFLLVILAIAAGLHWLADRPGTIVVEWQGYVAETSVFRAFILLLMLLARVPRRVVSAAPAVVEPGHRRPLPQPPAREARARCAVERHHRHRRRRPRAGRSLRRPGAQGAAARAAHPPAARAGRRSSTGDRATAGASSRPCWPRPTPSSSACAACSSRRSARASRRRRASSPSARCKLNPKLGWPVEALFDLQCRAGDWQGALDTLAIAQAAEPRSTRPSPIAGAPCC